MLSALSPDLDQWLPDPALRIVHSRESSANGDQLWAAAQAVRVSDTGLLGRLIRWRIPGTSPQLKFDQLFRRPPFIVLDGDQDHALVSGLVGRIWTIRRDYPQLSDPEEFRTWRKPGTARVLFANWLSEAAGGRTRLTSEVRVDANGRQGRIGWPRSGRWSPDSTPGSEATGSRPRCGVPSDASVSSDHADLRRRGNRSTHSVHEAVERLGRGRSCGG